MFLELSRSAASTVSGTIADSGFTHVWSHWGQRQIMAIEEKELTLFAVLPPLAAHPDIGIATKSCIP